MIWIESVRDAWTPCSEAQPDKDGYYLTCDARGRVHDLEYEGGWNCYRDNVTGEIVRKYEFTDIVAWMPLPEPYKGDNNGTVSNG